MIAYLIARLVEPSTWAGFGLIASGVTAALHGDTATAATEIAAGIPAVLVKEGK